MSGSAPNSTPRDAAVDVLRRLREAGHIAYLAGGCVRDELLRTIPKDYDVATDATPARVKTLFPKTQEVGAAFGVVLVRHLGSQLEVATFRSDGPYSDRRRPDAVTFSDPRSDALRRDFTVNALFLDPLAADESQRVIDFVGGRDDLAARVIRAVGDPQARLAEDHLRALRAVRLSARLGFEIEDGTAQAIREHAADLAGVSRERIGDEIRRMLTDASRGVAAWTLQYLGLDTPVLNEPTRVVAPVRLSRLGEGAAYTTALAAWALDRLGGTPDEPLADALVSRWRAGLCLTNDESAALRATLRDLGLLRGPWWVMGVALQKRTCVRPAFAEATRIVGTVDREEFVRIRLRVEELRNTPSGLAPMPFVTGDDLVDWGFSPGPGFKGVLDGVYDAQLEDRVRDREAASVLARELARRSGVQGED